MIMRVHTLELYGLLEASRLIGLHKQRYDCNIMTTISLKQSPCWSGKGFNEKHGSTG